MSTSPRTSRLYLFSIVMLALVFRIAFAMSALRSRPRAWFIVKTTELGELATSLLTNHTFSSPFGGHTGPSAFLTPGYPLFVATIFKLFGSFTLTSASIIMILQCCFGAAAVFVLMRFADRFFGAVTANIAGVIGAISVPLAVLPTLFWETALSILLLIAIVLLTVRSSEEPGPLPWIGLGFLSLIAFYTNPALVPTTLGCFAWLFATASPGKRRTPVYLTLIVLLLFSPWPIRNLRVMHAFIPLRDNLGYELWQGNRPDSDGSFDVSLHPSNNAQELARFNTLGELGYMREKSALARDTIRAYPERFLGLTALRIACFWTGAGHQSTWPMTLYTTFTAALGIAGLWMFYERNKKIAILIAIPLSLFPLPYYITHPDYRFRCLLDPLLTILTAYALAEWFLPQVAEKASDPLLD